MKLAVFIDNSGISNVEYKTLMQTNPGMGGTEYCILLFCEVYKKYYPENELTILCTADGTLPKVDSVVKVKNALDAVEYCSNLKKDILIMSSVEKGAPLSDEVFRAIDSGRQKTVLWGHNFYLSDFCKKIVKSEYVKANVFVGRQQYDRYIDNKVIFKSTYIYNMCPVVKDNLREFNDSKTVTYIGSLVPTKGFHLLAGAWKKVLKEVPDAQLNVIGSGKLYDRSSKLGSYGIAEAQYENSFIEGITNSDGKLLKSVHFHGVMGDEKKYIIAKTSVGVVNPSGRTETFGISAIDFSSRGIPVVTIGTGGFLDTVIDKQTGLLYNNVSDLSSLIVKLLKDNELNLQYGENAKEYVKKFAPEKVIKKWNCLFEDIMNGRELEFKQPDNFMNNNLKKFRVLNRKIKSTIHIEYPVSVIAAETFARNILRRLGR